MHFTFSIIHFIQLEGHKIPILQGRDKLAQPFTMQVLPGGMLFHSRTCCSGLTLQTLGD